MKVYTYSDARQKFSTVLESAQREGKVLVRRRDGRLFSIRPEKESESPFNVAGIKTKVETLEIIDILREERGRIG
jgi:hypothetical protein